MKRTLMTPLVLTAIIAYVAMANLLSGVSTFGSSYVQMVFYVFRTTSDMLIGKPKFKQTLFFGVRPRLLFDIFICQMRLQKLIHRGH